MTAFLCFGLWVQSDKDGDVVHSRNNGFQQIAGAKPQRILDVENRVLTAQVLEILERVTPVSKRRARKTYGML